EAARRVAVSATPLTLGTTSSADIVICDPTVSSRHCEIFSMDGGVIVRDLGSRNGTYVGGARIREAWGQEGMTVVVGQTSVVCHSALDEDDGEVGPPLPGVAGGSVVMCRVA